MNRTRKSWVFWLGVIILSACLVGGSSPAAAKEKTYPAREINICIGSPPGGSLDISGRVIARVLTKLMEQPMVIVNKPGGNQALSFAFVANARPDGYTLAYILNPYLTMKKLEEPDLPYDVDKMTWLGSMYHFNFMLTVKADSPWKTYEEFVDFGRKNPDKIIFGSDGAGGPQHINQLQFAEMVGIKSFIHVPFSGGGPAIQALLGGHVNAVTTSPGPTAAYVKSKDLRYLVNFAPIRNLEYPEVPSIKEKGVNLFTGGWMAFAGPKGLPAPIVERLVKDLKEAAMAEEVKPTFKNMGWEPGYHPPQDCVKMWKEEEVIFAKQMRKLGMIK